jgi:hypothetical protein
LRQDQFNQLFFGQLFKFVPDHTSYMPYFL